MVNQYRVRPGFRHGKNKQYGPGDTVELTEREAVGFLDKLELVGPAPAEDAPVEVVEDKPTPARSARGKKAAG